jgi:LPS sulfotransferase NodH
MQRFLVLAGRRSGVTLLVDSLNSHPEIECTKDVFTTRRHWRRFQIDVKTGLFYQFRSASLARQIAYLCRRKQLVGDFLTERFSSVDDLRARGIRLSYEQERKYPQALRWALHNDVPVLHLFRENSLKAIVSHFTAKKRGVAHATSKLERVTLRLPPRELKKMLIERERSLARYRRQLAGHRCHEISYESFVAGREAETRRILEFLGIDQFLPLTSRWVKQNSDTLQDILENYDEIAGAFRATTFERYLTM